MKIIDNVYLIPGVMANSYLLVDPDGLTIIDTGMPYSEKKTLEYIARLGRSAREIRRILITHADLDHYGCLAALQDGQWRTHVRKPRGSQCHCGRQIFAAGQPQCWPFPAFHDQYDGQAAHRQAGAGR